MFGSLSFASLLQGATLALATSQTVLAVSIDSRADNAKPGKPPGGGPPSNGGGAWPYAPLVTKGRDIVDSRGKVVNWAGVNWPMSGESMIFEGLEYNSAENILDDVASVGWNWIRAGYAIQMVDEIYDNGGKDMSIEASLINALGEKNGTKVLQDMIKHNPRWNAQTTRFQVLGDVADLAAERGIFVHPDVHVGKAEWCCSHTDGNAWFDDLNFPADNWKRGLSYMANFAKNHSAIQSMSLRNELRSSFNDTSLMYNWVTFVGNMTEGADAIHSSNPNLLITWSGLQYDQDLSALTTGKNLNVAPAYKADSIRDAYRIPKQTFDLDAHPWNNKIVYELHLYDAAEDLDVGTCDIIQAELYYNGFNAIGMKQPKDCGLTKKCEPATRKTPVMLSEFGHAQEASLYDDVLQNCLKEFTLANKVSWAVWSLAGSYRIRQGVQSFDDTWGLTNHDWSGWRDQATIDGYWKPWVKGSNPTHKA